MTILPFGAEGPIGGRIYFEEHSSPLLPIRCDGVPFQFVGRQIRECWKDRHRSDKLKSRRKIPNFGSVYQRLDKTIIDKIYSLVGDDAMLTSGEGNNRRITSITLQVPKKVSPRMTMKEIMKKLVLKTFSSSINLLGRSVFWRNMVRRSVCWMPPTRPASLKCPCFVCVNTNSGYVVVGSFVLPTETTYHIKRGLAVLKSWNPTWKPPYFITDYDRKEMKAIEETFPGCFTILCDFHREQSWKRWVGPTNGVTHPKEVLELLRSIANSSDEQSFTEAVDALKESSHWNKRLQDWFQTFWLKESKLAEEKDLSGVTHMEEEMPAATDRDEEMPAPTHMEEEMPATTNMEEEMPTPTNMEQEMPATTNMEQEMPAHMQKEDKVLRTILHQPIDDTRVNFNQYESVIGAVNENNCHWILVFVENYLAGKSLKFTWTKKDVAEKRKSVTDLNSTDEQVGDWQRDNAAAKGDETFTRHCEVREVSLVMDEIIKRISDDVLVQEDKVCSMKRPTFGERDGSTLEQIFTEYRVIYLEYVFNLLAKEACALLLSNILTLNYDIVDQECRKTETTKRQFLS
ncbi:hypothetical protein MAR_031075 [Mya arenaria]|uniref:MULE transposase domain-containing protein n=1 Tax=Mya arenaria TaxID=6604 RepID=A0ABY7FAY5_MYAAR|nr:hypothetical protein MAR_031075 [Mya arenaria]